MNLKFCGVLEKYFNGLEMLTLPHLRGEGGVGQRFSSITFDRDKILKGNCDQIWNLAQK